MPVSAEEKKMRNKLAVNKYQEKNKDKIVAYRTGRKAIHAAYMLIYSVVNGDKMRATSARWDAENAERAKQNRAAYYQSNKDLIRERHRAWRDKNPEKVVELKRQWNSANPERASEIARTSAANRRSRKKFSGGRLSTGLAQQLLKLQRGKCACCGTSLKDGYHLDHITPLARGGANEDWNMQLLTPKCNQQKHAKDPVEFMQSRGRLL
jgi:5-methylcytosine-specific restriction endonuclease McrA